MASKTKFKWLRARPDERPDKVAARVLRARLKDVWNCLTSVAKSKRQDPQTVHALRVATRRAAAALTLFDEFLPSNRAAWFSKQLKRLRRAAGEARDLDILAERIEQELPRDEGRALSAQVRERRAEAQGPMLERYKRLRRHHRFEQRCEQLLKRIRRRNPDCKKSEQPRFGDWSRRAIAPLVAEFFDAEPDHQAEAEAWHRFRIRGKALRYGMELLSGAFSPAWRDLLYPLVTDLQDRLGTLNDLATAGVNLRKTFDNPSKESQAALDDFVSRQQRRQEELREEFSNWYFVQVRDDLRSGLRRELKQAPELAVVSMSEREPA